MAISIIILVKIIFAVISFRHFAKIFQWSFISQDFKRRYHNPLKIIIPSIHHFKENLKSKERLSIEIYGVTQIKAYLWLEQTIESIIIYFDTSLYLSWVASVEEIISIINHKIL